MKLPEKLMKAAKAADDKMGVAMVVALPRPRTPYSANAVRDLQRALAKVVTLFGVDYAPAPPSGPQSELDADTVRMLAMVAKAAEDYGGRVTPLDRLLSDDSLLMLTGQLEAMSKDAKFSEWLQQDAEEEDMLSEVGEAEDMLSEEEGMEEVMEEDMEEDMLSEEEVMEEEDMEEDMASEPEPEVKDLRNLMRKRAK
jgi:hypothetical protein